MKDACKWESSYMPKGMLIPITTSSYDPYSKPMIGVFGRGTLQPKWWKNRCYKTNCYSIHNTIIPKCVGKLTSMY